MTDLNTYIQAERTNRYIAAGIKKRETARVAWACKEQQLRPVTRPLVEVIFHWYSKDARKDADNISFACKFIFDGLVKAKVLPDDSQKYTGSIVHHFDVDAKNPRVEVDLI